MALERFKHHLHILLGPRPTRPRTRRLPRSEINYALNNLYGTNLPWETIDYAIAAKMSSYWVNFAITGNPNTGGSCKNGTLVIWNPSVVDLNITMHLGDGWSEVPLASDAQIENITQYFARQVTFYVFRLFMYVGF